MRTSNRFVLLFGLLACLVVIGVMIPLRLHRVEGSAQRSGPNAEMGAPVARPVSQAVTPTPPRQTPNDLQDFNYSFETDEGWYVGDEANCIYFRPYEAYHGQRSAQIVGRERVAECKWWSHTRELDDLVLAAGHHYYFSGRIRTDGFESGSQAYFSLVFFGLDGYYKKFDTISVNTNTIGDWLEVSTLVEVPPQAERARVECQSKGKGQMWFDYLFLGLDIALEFTKTAFPTEVERGDLVTHTLIYSNTGLEPARNVRIHEFYDSDTRFVTAMPLPDDYPLSNDEWTIGTLTTTTGSIVVVVQVDSDSQKKFLQNWTKIESSTQVYGFDPVELELWASAVVSGPNGCAVCVYPPPLKRTVTSPGKTHLSHKVHNCGGVTTDITVTVSAPDGWTVTPSTIPIPGLPSSHTSQVEVEVTVPSGVPSDTEENVIWTAIAACGADTRTDMTDTIQVIKIPKIFLPVVTKRYYVLCPDSVGDPCNGQDHYEPNNAYCSTTASLISGVSVKAPICSPTDRNDYYYLDVAVTGTLEILLTDLPSGTDYDLYLYYGRMQYVTRSVNSGTLDEHIEYDIPADKLGRYYVLVYSDCTWSSQLYTLRASYPVQAGSQ